jgi:hypothetical protein
LKAKMLFVGLDPQRVQSIVSSIEEHSDIEIATETACGLELDGRGRLLDRAAVFISRDLEEPRLPHLLESIRQMHFDIPIVLVYEAEPDGKAYLYANKYDCLLYSEMDRVGRTLSAKELAGELEEISRENDISRKLMELSLSAGPCSTGE